MSGGCLHALPTGSSKRVGTSAAKAETRTAQGPRPLKLLILHDCYPNRRSFRLTFVAKSFVQATVASAVSNCSFVRKSCVAALALL